MLRKNENSQKFAATGNTGPSAIDAGLNQQTADNPDHIDVGAVEHETANCFNLNREAFKMLVSLAISFMGFILAMLSIQIFNELGALYDEGDQCVNQYIP